MIRGELWWANLPEPVGHRPVLLLSRNRAYVSRALIIVAPLTTQIRNVRAEVALGREEGLRRESVANLESLATIPKDALQDRIGALSPPKITEVDDALRFALGLDN